MTMMHRRRWLAIIVHPRDIVASRSKRTAVELALGCGALDLLQLRATESDNDADVLTAGAILAQLVKEQAEQPSLNKFTTRFVVNHGSLEVALQAGASGWHLKERFVVGRSVTELERDLQCARIRNIIVGCSVHSVEAAMLAAACGFDYIQVGTMFSTPSHPEKSQASLLEGPDLLRRIQSAWHVTTASDPTAALCPPLIAVGGIHTNDHVNQVLEAGADGIAVIRGILADTKPEEATWSYRTWLDN